MKNVIITGATGMIGRSLIDYLTKKDINVLAIVRRDGEFFPKNDKLKIIKCDLSNLKNLNLSQKYDTFYHLAWMKTTADGRNDYFTQTLNINYTLDAVEFAYRSGCKTFIGAGSQAEYGRVDGIISPNIKTNPENGYGIAKLAAGQMSRLLANEHNIKHIWARIISAYGPYDNESTMVMSSIKSMVDYGISPEYTKAEQIWNYIYSKDVAKAFYLLGEKGINNSIYCISSTDAKQLFEYIEIIKNNIDPNIKLKIGAKDYLAKQVMNLKCDISNLEKDTGFYPEYSFDEGIKETISWYKEMKGRKKCLTKMK